MTIVRLRKVGGSTMLVIPPSLMDALELTLDTPVSLSVDEGKLTVAAARPRYKLAELLAECSTGPQSAEEREWLDAPAAGSEI